MSFIVYQNTRDRDCFIVTDPAHEKRLNAASCCPEGGTLRKIGVFGEIGTLRLAFDERLAKGFIEKQGYYKFHAKTYDPVATMPAAMPV